jgi:uncharacterized membrane protein
MKPYRYFQSINSGAFKLITLSSFCCLGILLFRIKYTQSIYFLFLVWNLFLAFIPLALSTYILSNFELKKWKLISLLAIWILFLPNAPYIVTDLFQLKKSSNTLIWLDVMVIGSFAFAGLIAFYLTILDFRKIISKHLNSKGLKFVSISVYFLCGVGVYLGRYLRFNSWDILNRPHKLFLYIFESVFIHADEKLYVFSITFGMVLWAGVLILDQLRTFNSN